MKTKDNKKSSSKISSNDSYKEEENFVKKLKKGFEKFRGKLPFKFLLCSCVQGNQNFYILPPTFLD